MARFNEIITQKDGIYKKYKDKLIKISNPMGIEKKITNIDTDEELAEIWYEHNGKKKTISVEREVYLNTNGILSLQKFGVDVLQETSRDLIRHFRNEEDKAKVEFVHSILGFGIYNGIEIYKNYYVKSINSTYCGEYEIKSKGTKEAWLDMFEKEVLGNPALELICSVSVSSVITSYLGDMYGLQTLIFHLVGNSTSGKSTASKLAISMFGYADVKKNGLFSTYNSTENAIMKQLAGRNGVPSALDEISMANTNSFDNFVYKIHNGSDKDRLNKNSKIIKKEYWSGTLISNGEKSLIESGSKNPGIPNRVIEASNVKWTMSAENAENIAKVIRNNYGHVGVKFAEYIMEIGREKLGRMYEESIERVVKLMSKHTITDTFTKRRANMYAVIYLSANILEKVLDVELNLNGIMNILIDIERKSIETRNFEIEFIDYLKMYIDMNRKKFLMKNQTVNGEVWGKIRDRDDYMEVAINQIKFRQIVKEAKYEDVNVVIQGLKEKGALDHEKGRNYRKRKNELGVPTKYYVIKLFK